MMNLKYIEEAFAIAVLMHAARNFPMPKNAYAKWLLGVVQFALANYDLGKQNFKDVPMDDNQRDSAPPAPSTSTNAVETAPKG